MNNTGLIVHDIMDGPHRWSVEGPDVTNGYYRISLNGSQYGVGSAKYHSNPGEEAVLLKAVNHWKISSGYDKPEPKMEVVKTKPKPAVKAPVEDATARLAALEAFLEAIKRAHAGYKMHMESSVFSNAVDAALSQYEGKFIQTHGQKSDRNSQKTGV